MRVKELQKNQFAIEAGDKTFFQSYKSVIAKVEHGKLTLGPDWCYSTTTSKWLHKFLEDYCYKYARYSKKEMQNAIKSGEVQLDPALDM